MKISLLILFFLSNAWAQHSSYGVGNGGGVICINNVCKTLIDAGLKVSMDYPDFWLPETNLINDVNYKVNRFPFDQDMRASLIERIFLDLTHFKKVDVIDQAKLNDVTEFYKDTLQQKNPSLDFTNFKVAALSSDNTSDDPHTFLLPEFFRLSSDQQAQILIHEGIYRGRENTKLKNVLQLDTALSQFFPGQLSKLATIDDFRTVMITAQIALYNLDLMSKGNLFAHLVYTGFSKNVDNYIDNKYSNFETYATLPSMPFKCDMSFKVNKSAVLSSKVDARLKVLLLNLDVSRAAYVFTNTKPFKEIYYNVSSDTMEFNDKVNYCQLINFNNVNFILPN